MLGGEIGSSQKKSLSVLVFGLTVRRPDRYRAKSETRIPKEPAMQTASDSPNSPAKNPPPYFAFKTLLNTLDQMKEKGIPTRVDRTFLVGMSGAGQTQFIAGLKSLGLIDGSGAVQPRFTELVQASPTDRKRVLGEVLRDRYPEAVELGTTNATTGQLVEVFRDYGVTGDTARKAIAFYLGAARYAGDVPVSPMFTTPKVTSSPGAKRRPKRSKLAAETNNGDNPPDPPANSGGGGYSDLHPALAGVLSELPKRGRGWTVARRAEFMATFQAVANFTIPVIEDEYETEEDEIEEDETTL
jgi:hypothetical protein